MSFWLKLRVVQSIVLCGTSALLWSGAFVQQCFGSILHFECSSARGKGSAFKRSACDLTTTCFLLYINQQGNRQAPLSTCVKTRRNKWSLPRSRGGRRRKRSPTAAALCLLRPTPVPRPSRLAYGSSPTTCTARSTGLTTPSRFQCKLALNSLFDYRKQNLLSITFLPA